MAAKLIAAPPAAAEAPKAEVKKAEAKKVEPPAGPPPEIEYGDFQKVSLRAGKVLAAVKVPKADKLLQLTIDLGEGAPRTIVSGIAEAYTPEAVGRPQRGGGGQPEAPRAQGHRVARHDPHRGQRREGSGAPRPRRGGPRRGGAVSDWRAERQTALARLAGEKDVRLRAEAAEALCGLALEAPETAAPEFAPHVPVLLADEQPEVRCAGVALAGEVLPPHDAREVFLQALTDRTGRVRVEAAGRLADLALPDTRGTLAALLQDELFEVRFEAARGMAALQHAAGFDVLVEALDSAEFRFRAASALAQLGRADAVPHLRRALTAWFLPAFDRTQVAGALARLGDDAGRAHLLKRARKGWSMDRPMALELLGEVKAPGARALLEGVLADAADPCRGPAARGLGRLGDPAAEGALAAIATDPAAPDSLRLDAAEGLLRLGTPTARALAGQVNLVDAEARQELAAMLAESP